MAQAELRLRAVMDDDASRGLDQLTRKVEGTATAQERANRKIGSAAATAATQVRSASTRAASAYASTTRAAKDYATQAATLARSKAPAFVGRMADQVSRLRDGYRNAGAAASTFSGKAGSIGGGLRKITDQTGRAVRGLKGLGGEAASAGRDIGRRMVDGVKSRMSNLGNSLKGGLKNAGAVAGAAVGAAFVLQMGVAIRNAGALEQSMGAIKAIFKDSASEMYGYSSTAAKTVGLSKLEYQELATLIGAQLKNGGMAMDQLAGKTNDLVSVGADLSSMFGGTTREAVEALNSALRGENDPIEKYGITLTAAKVEAEAAALGFSKVGGELQSNAKQAAILSLVQKQSVDSMGNFAKETTTFSGSIQILKARWADLTTNWAGYVLPILGRLIGFIGGPVMDALDNMTNGWAAFWTFLHGGSDADWGVLTGVEAAAGKAGEALHNIAAGAADGLGQAATYGRQFVDSVNWPAVAGWFLDIYRAISPLGPALHGFAIGAGEGFTQLGITVGQAIGIIAPALIPVITGLAQVTAKILELVGPLLPVLIPLIGGTILAFKGLSAVVTGVKFVAGAISLIPVALRLIGPALAAVPIIGWVALGISALVLMYQKVGWFRDAVNAAFAWITGAVRNAADWVVEAWRNAGNILNSIQAGIQLVAGAVANWWTTTVVPLWQSAVAALGAAMSWLKTTIIDPIWFGIRFTIAVVVGAVMTLWQGLVWSAQTLLAPIFGWLADVIIKPAFSRIQLTIALVTAWWQTYAVPMFNAATRILGSVFGWLSARVTSVMGWIQAVVERARAWIAMKFWATQVALGQLGAWFMRLYYTYVSPALTWVSNKIGQVAGWFNARRLEMQGRLAALGGRFLNLYYTYVAPTWNWIRDKIGGVWNWVRDRAINPLMKLVEETLPAAFRRAKDAVGAAWDGIKDKIWSPIKAALDFIKTHLIGNINKVLEKMGMDPIKVAWTEAASAGPGNAPVRAGGIRGFYAGGYTGAGPTHGVAGEVHNDEHVIRAVSRRSVEDHYPGFLDQLNRKGAAALTNPAHAAVGAAVYGGYGSFTNPLQHHIARTGTLNVSGSAPGWDLPGAIGMVDRATGVKVRAGSGGANTVHVNAGPMPAWWAGYYEGNSVRLNSNAIGPGIGRRTVAAHELGHALGLPHSDPSGIRSIMSYANMYQHNSMTSADVKALSAIYGGDGKAGGGGDFVSDLIDTLMKGLQAVIDRLKGNQTAEIAKSIVDGVTGFMFKKAKDFILNIGDGGEERTTQSVQDMNRGRALTASRGRIIPGYTPRTDQTPILASRGESVLTPELTRALGPRNIEAANLASSGNRAGGPAGALGLLGTRPGAGAAGVIINLDVTIEGNASTETVAELRDEIEDLIRDIFDDADRRGY